MELEAVVLADSPLASVRIAGLTARERAIRVAERVGARRVIAVDRAGDRENLVGWRGDSAAALLVIRADQLVHTPLVQPLVDHFAGASASAGAHSGAAIAVGDLPADDYAGAFIAIGAAATTSITALAGGDTDAAVAASLTGAARVHHGAIARHAIATREDRRGAHKLLYRILVKPQDNAITRYLYRPVSMPLTRLLVWTPITPNQISCAVAVLVAFGCWLTARASYADAVAGTAIVLAASYLDCCDGEIARLKLRSSKLGAWLDTVIDELSSLGYMVALGWHCHLAYGPHYFDRIVALPFDPWIVAAAATAAIYALSIYIIYYNIIVAVGSANSQDYASSFEVIAGAAPNAVRLVPITPARTASTLPAWLQPIAKIAPYVVRRDFISWAATALAALACTALSFGMFVAGGLAAIVVLVRDHLRLRALRRSLARAGRIVEAPR